jgi:cysteine desulfurase
MKQIYLDYAATTPVDRKVLKAMLPYFSEKFGNASSLHSSGNEASEAVEKARKHVANFFGAKENEIIFTSGATEANNLAIKGILMAYFSKVENKNTKPHIITTAFEHPCVLNTVKKLSEENLIEATFINPQKDGIIKVDDIKKEIRSNTILISVMYVNNEIGTIQPIEEIGKMIKKINDKIIFHTDATQAVNYLNCNVDKLGVDLLSMSAHKIYGPKGVGALYIRKGTEIKRIQDGGGQENSMRAGTSNTAGIVGLGTAIAMIKSNKKENNEIKKLRDYLIKKLLKEIPKTKLNGSKIKRIPNNANFIFGNIEGESLIIMLDKRKIACSTGSACSSGSLAPSHVLLSLGLEPEETHGSLRISLGKYTTKKEIDYAIGALKEFVKKLRNISGNILRDYYNK